MGRRPKDKKAARVDSGKARQADYDRAILERKRTEPPYKYTELCPVEELRKAPETARDAWRQNRGW